MSQEGIAVERQKFVQETSLHGISNIGDGTRHILRRLLWLLMVLTMAGVLCFFIYGSLSRFFSYPTNTVIEFRRDFYVDFPSVTICNSNKVNKTYLELGDSTIVPAALSQLTLFPMSLDYNDPVALEELEQIDMEYSGKASAHTLEETILRGMFDSTLDLLNSDKKNDLLVRTMTEMGYCFSFHPLSYIEKHGALKVRRRGARGGLQLEMNVHEELYFYYTGKMAGMKVVVHDPHVEPSMLEEGVNIAPGMETDIVIDKKERETLPLPFNDGGVPCIETNTSKNASFVNPLEHFEYYSFSACKMNCLIQFINESCGCRKFYHHAPNLTLCSFINFITCAQDAEIEYYKNITNEMKCDCFQPCHEIYYGVTLSTAVFPTDDAMKLYYPNSNSTEYPALRKNLISLNIYFKDIGQTVIKQEQGYTGISCFAEIGGLLGLCLGASILTGGEILELILVSCFVACKKRENTKVSQVEELPPKHDMVQEFNLGY